VEQADIEAAIKDLKGSVLGRIESIEKYMTLIEKKAARPRAGGGDDQFGGGPEQKAVQAAFGKYVRTGNDTELKSLSTTTGPDGAFGVPKVIEQLIESIAVNISPIRSVAKVQSVSTQDYHYLLNIRGTSSAWVGETAARPSTNTPQFEDVAPPMGDLYAFPMATQVMLDDVQFNAENWLAEEIATEFARAEGSAFINGTGVTQPRGFLTYTNVATGDATRAFGSLEYFPTGSSAAFKTTTTTVNPSDDLFTLVSKMKAAYRPDAVWLMNKDTLFKIAPMKDIGGRYIFNPTTGPGVPDTILGYPVLECEDMPAIAANSYSVAFANLRRGYIIVDRTGVRVIRDNLTNKPYVGFYTVARRGGAVLNSECIKLLKFSAS
jgi:HK97 family phage major capsid protein